MFRRTAFTAHRVSALTVLAVLGGALGCQGRNGTLFHPYGVTRVAPPPTHSYTIPQSYYQKQPAAGAGTSGSAPVGSGVTSARTVGGITLEGMPVNDATRVVSSNGASPAAKSPVTAVPRAPGLQFIRRMSWESPVGGKATNQPPVTNVRNPASGGGVEGAQPSATSSQPIGNGVRTAVWRER